VSGTNCYLCVGPVNAAAGGCAPIFFFIFSFLFNSRSSRSFAAKWFLLPNCYLLLLLFNRGHPSFICVHLRKSVAQPLLVLLLLIANCQLPIAAL